MIEEITADINEAQAVFAVDYRGITVTQVADLRSKLRESDTTFRVVKNTLTERAADQAGAESLRALLEGPTALAFVKGDAAAAAKTISDTAKEIELLSFKGGLMDGNALSVDDIKAISKLPSREVLYGQLVGIVASPITGLARSLNGLLGGLAIALAGVQEKKESGEIPSGDAPAAAAEPEAAAAPAEAPAEEAPAEEAAPEPEAEAPAEEPTAEAEAPADAAPTENNEE
ncbi:50S ribosomal protein L10 [Svornostia abyssi]|uniref:Large ribosomal subunit protein uL10 n=1 Tax=Svornostia abyssi TaxID=2898438 RepID=A0ABY5PGE7_9ACTN|nr:50S ribosomal protein L10 [Parviterribacteraceae bacterium J379]